MRGPRAAARAAWEQTKNGFTSLSGSPRDLYVVFALKVLESYNYFSLSRIFTLYLTEEFGVDDYRAGTLYGLWGTLLTAYGFLLGGAIDYLGVKLSLIICFVLNIGSRLVMASTTSKWMLLVMLLGPNTLAGALGVPVMTIGVKRCTHAGNRGFAFALFYSLMNCAALSQGVLMDAFRIGMPHGFNIPSLPERSLLNSGSRLFLASGCVTSLVGLLVTFFLSEKPHTAAPKQTSSEMGGAAGLLEGSVHSQRTNSSVELELPTSPEAPLLGASGSGSGTIGSPAPRHRLPGGGKAAAQDEAVGSGDASAAARQAGVGEGQLPLRQQAGQQQQQRRQSAAEFWEGVRAVLRSRGFYKYLLMCFFTVNLKSVFRHLDATLPKYQIRAFGCNFPIGAVYSINPFMIVLLVPLVGAMTTDYQHFDMIHIGGWISALSPFFIVAFNTAWSTAAFVALLSLGEAIWSPRWYDYSMGVAPDGREGIFTALASAPLFAAMLPTGMISGALLQAYCPDNGQCVDRDQPDAANSTSSSSGSAGSGSVAADAGRRLLSFFSGKGDGRWLQGVAAAVGEGGDTPAAFPCDGRMLWLIVGLITLSSPLLVLLTQRWLRPAPRDFARLHDAQRIKPGGTTTEGECFDTNEADPLGLLENVYESSLLHAAESGGVPGGSQHPGSAGGQPAVRPASASAS